MTVHYVDGDLLESDADIIAHQCNVTSNHATGIAGDIFNRWPESNLYGYNPAPRMYGKAEIVVRKDDPSKRIANLYAQYMPGKATYGPDTPVMRQTAFKQALYDLLVYADAGEPKLTIAMPFNIGCGLAGGNWNEYKELIENEARQFDEVEVYIVRKT